MLDEPFAGLDDRARRDLSAALARLRAERDLTLVCVSHDRDLPPALVDREIELTDGRITYDGPGRERRRRRRAGEAAVTAPRARRSLARAAAASRS